MVIQNYEELKLADEMFAEIRESFDVLLQKLFKKMEDNNSDEGVIDLKLSIGIRPEFVPGEDGKDKQVNVPVIKHKISTQVPVKDALDGTKDTGMALIYDEELKRYVLKYVQIDGQMSIYDMDMQGDSEEGVIDVPAQIEGAGRLAIPMKADTEDADGDSDGSDSTDEEIMEDEENNGADGVTETQDDDYYYDEP